MEALAVMPNVKHTPTKSQQSNMTVNPGGGENSNAGGHSTVTAPSPGTEAATQPSGTDARASSPSRNLSTIGQKPRGNSL